MYLPQFCRKHFDSVTKNRYYFVHDLTFKRYNLLKTKFTYFIKVLIFECKSTCFILGEKTILKAVTGDQLDFDEEIKVMQVGRTSGTTFGLLKHDSLAIKITPLFSNKFMVLCNCYAVENIDDPFFQAGDSGAGVYLVKNDELLQPLGIAFGTVGQTTAVCKIDEFLDALNLRIVSYKNMDCESPRQFQASTKMMRW